VTPWASARQASLSLTSFWSLPKFMSIHSVMPSNHLVFVALFSFCPQPFTVLFCPTWMSVLSGLLPKLKTESPALLQQHPLYQMSELWPQETVLARLHLSLFHWSGSFTRVGPVFPTSSPHLAPVSAPVTVLWPNPQVCEWRPPEELKRLLDLELRDAGAPHHRLLQRCQDVIRYSVKTSKSSPLHLCCRQFLRFL